MAYRKPKSFRCNTYKKRRGRGAAFPRRSDIQTCGRSEDPSVPLQPNAFGATIRKGREISSRSEETTPLSSVSKTIERTSGTVRRCSRLPRLGRGCKLIALRSHLQEGLGPSFYYWTVLGRPALPASVVDRLTVAMDKGCW